MTTVSTGAEPTAIGANDQDLPAGTEVGEYRIERVLGKGGFGVVYAAIQPVIGKQVAIKLLARKYSADPDIVSRFVAEARAVNQIRHRNIIDIFSFGHLSDGRHYYVMEYLDGDPLDAYLRNHGPLPLDEALPILRAIARALDAAHAKGIAHRDLKPENIFLARDPDGGVFPKLLDFGIAKLLTPDDDVRHKTNTGVPIGTPYYMSPEQCRGKDVDHRTDIYSFGIVAYRLLTGTFPFEGDDYMELLYKQVNEEPVPPSSRNADLPTTVDEAVAWMMRKDRNARPPTVVEGVNALDPTAAITPSIPPARGSKPTVPPAGPVAFAKTSTPDALAATFTPEFERPQLATSAVATSKLTNRRGLYVGIGVAIVLAAAAGDYLLTRGTREDRKPAAAPPAAATAPAPTPEPTPAPPPPPTPTPTPPTHPTEQVTAPPVATDTKQKPKPTQHVRTVPADDKKSSPQAPAPDDDKHDDHSTIPLGSDAFK